MNRKTYAPIALLVAATTCLSARLSDTRLYSPQDLAQLVAAAPEKVDVPLCKPAVSRTQANGDGGMAVTGDYQPCDHKNYAKDIPGWEQHGVSHVLVVDEKPYRNAQRPHFGAEDRIDLVVEDSRGLVIYEDHGLDGFKKPLPRDEVLLLAAPGIGRANSQGGVGEYRLSEGAVVFGDSAALDKAYLGAAEAAALALKR